MTILQNPIFVEQYKHFRNWIAEAQRQRDDAARFAIIANAAIAAWVVTAKDVAPAAYLLPLATTAMMFAYWFALRRKVLEAGDAVARFEALAGLDETNGAEIEYRKRTPNVHNWRRVFLTREAPVWACLVAFDLFFAFAVGGNALRKWITSP